MPVQGTRFLRFSRNFGKFYERQFLPVLRETGLTMREVHVLLFLANNPEYDTAREITALRGIGKSQVSQAVELLAAEGLLSRRPDREDRRMVHLSVTEQGRPLARRCQELQAACWQRLLEGLCEEEQAQFHRLLETVLDNGVRLAEEAET